jgi:hypothetical protein
MKPNIASVDGGEELIDANSMRSGDTDGGFGNHC